jgi:hypothetical protein
MTMHHRIRTRAAAVALACAGAATLVSACSSGAAATPAGPGANVKTVSFQQVQNEIGALYRADASITAFKVDDVQYSTSSRDKVLGVCRNGAAASDEDALESAKVMACAPLIYYYYSFGTEHSADDSLTVADDLYDYAVTQITGPFNAQQTIDQLLRSWGVPVASGASATPSPLGTAGIESGLLADARTAMNDSAGVHMVITSATTSGTTTSTRTAVMDSGATSAVETLTDGTATGHLVVTSADAYFSGDSAGLGEFFGMSAQDVARIGTAWVSMASGTSQYTNFSAGSLIASIPSTLMPSTDAVTLTDATDSGRPVYRLAWTSFGSDASAVIKRTLDLDASGQHLPVSETSTSTGATQTVAFSAWGTAVDPAVPDQTLTFSQATAS